MTDDCKVVKWKNCKLVPRDVAFTVPKVDCQDGEKVEYKTCKRVDKEIMTSQLTCEVKSEPSCKPEIVTKVRRSKWEGLVLACSKSYPETRYDRHET